MMFEKLRCIDDTGSTKLQKESIYKPDHFLKEIEETGEIIGTFQFKDSSWVVIENVTYDSSRFEEVN
jgi:cytochrome b involved in lipid metabolism